MVSGYAGAATKTNEIQIIECQAFAEFSYTGPTSSPLSLSDVQWTDSTCRLHLSGPELRGQEERDLRLHQLFLSRAQWADMTLQMCAYGSMGHMTATELLQYTSSHR